MHYMGDSKISSAERDRIMSAPPLALTVPQIVRMAELAREVHDEFLAWIKPRMTRDRAERIRKFRCGADGCDGWSYRAIAGTTHLEWGADANWEPWTNQLAGVALCEAAAELLGEDVESCPWQANQA